MFPIYENINTSNLQQTTYQWKCIYTQPSWAPHHHLLAYSTIQIFKYQHHTIIMISSATTMRSARFVRVLVRALCVLLRALSACCCVLLRVDWRSAVHHHSQHTSVTVPQTLEKEMQPLTVDEFIKQISQSCNVRDIGHAKSLVLCARSLFPNDLQLMVFHSHLTHHQQNHITTSPLFTHPTPHLIPFLIIPLFNRINIMKYLYKKLTMHQLLK